MRIQDEFEGASFGDQRLSRRLQIIVGDLGDNPDMSFPEAAADDSSLEGTYRFLNNENVTPERILEPHFEATAQRIRLADNAVIVDHDSTEFIHRGEQMGQLGEGRVGFIGHFSLAVTSDDAKAPLGLLFAQNVLRPAKGYREKLRRERARAPDNERLRWIAGVKAAEERIGLPGKLVHVMDREADSYPLFASMVRNRYRFVARMTFDREVEIGERTAPLTYALRDVPQLMRFEVPVREKPPVTRRGPKPQQDKRIATVALSATNVRIRRPRALHDVGPAILDLNVVLVRELKPPKGNLPIEWRLLTSEPISTVLEVEAIVEIYRRRWIIEEYFRALKQGCALEKRQLENRHAIVNALAVFVPIAFQLLRLRTLARESPTRPARDVLTALQLELLQRHPKLRLPETPTVRDAMLSIAQLGGHIKNNGDPGWIVLGRGYEKLLTLEEGAELSRAVCDQS